MSQPSAACDWLSPTRAWRLIECPASVRHVAASGTGSARDQEANAGTLAHVVLERWIVTEGYRAPDPKAALSAAAEACAEELPGGPPTNWSISRARLVARGISLANLIGDRLPGHVLSEIELKDEDLRLRGQLDLLLLGDEIVVVDLKTQTLLGEGLPEWVAFQMTVYAHLIRKTYATLPSRAEVFSLNKGRKKVPITEESLQEGLAALASARAADPLDANPSPDVCSFCVRRFVCEPHWNVAMDWPDTDAVEGTVRRVEPAATGVVALLLITYSGPAWLSGIPEGLADVSPGDEVRVVRVRRVDTSGGDFREWRWQSLSALKKA